MLRFAGSLAVFYLLFVATAVAQSRPNFAGTWTQSNGTVLSITQNGQAISVTSGADKLHYNLDGSDSRNSGANGSTLTSQARWVGSALVVATTTMSPIGTWQDLDFYSMDYGPKLIVVHVRTQTTNPMMGTTVETYVRPASVAGGR